jgi:signal transduction histidine kinase/DNA-binding response OmpR family regulator
MLKLLAILVLLPVLSFAQQEERAVLDSLLGRYTSREYKKMDDNDKVEIISAITGNYKEASKYYKYFVDIRDSMLSRNKLVQIAELGTEREAYLKEKQIAINNIQVANKNKERILFITIATLLGVVVVSIRRSNRKLAAEKQKSDDLAINLQELLIQKDVLTDQLSLAADMKTRFLANISHELRTPVTLLTGMLELMKEDKEKANGSGNKDRMDVAYNNSRKLQFMVEEILDLSRIETTRTKLKIENRDIAPILKRMVYAFETFIEKEQINLQYSENNIAGIHISADENLLEKVVNNLVYNAIKFNERGGSIKVHVFTSPDKKQFIFTINNSGSIIKPEDLPHIFERFYQGDTVVVKAEGVGIGLSLVKEFTLLMGGTVRATSMEGVGTTFTLQFPVTEVRVSEKRTDIEREEEPAEVWEHFPERQTVLIVEDNPEMRFYLREVLSGKVNLAEATNGKKALEWLSQNKADMIVTDLMMPEMGGEEFVGYLKANDIYKKIPVITLTARADTNNRLDMLRLGIDDYIVKPFDASELRVRVYNLLTNLEERRQFESNPPEHDDIPAESKEAQQFRQRITEFVLARMKTVEVSVYDLAYELSMSERQLYRLSKTMAGCTPAQLIKEVRLQKAYELLLSGTIYKVDDVARQVGFENSGYFSRQFYERFGKRPTEFL